MLIVGCAAAVLLVCGWCYWRRRRRLAREQQYADGAAPPSQGAKRTQRPSKRGGKANKKREEASSSDSDTEPHSKVSPHAPPPLPARACWLAVFLQRCASMAAWLPRAATALLQHTPGLLRCATISRTPDALLQTKRATTSMSTRGELLRAMAELQGTASDNGDAAAILMLHSRWVSSRRPIAVSRRARGTQSCWVQASHQGRPHSFS